MWTSALATGVDESDTRLNLTVPLAAQRGSNFVVVDTAPNEEIVEVSGIGGAALFVRRGVMGTAAVAHSAGAPVGRYALSSTVAAGTAVASHPDLATHDAM